MGDVIPFLVLAVIAVAAWVIYLAFRTPNSRALPPPTASLQLLDHPKVNEWYKILQSFDDVAQQQLNDVNIKPFLPEEMQRDLRALHDRFRRSI